MIVWLWDASGPARKALGVTGDEATAREAAEASLNSGACSARVEAAHAVLEIDTLTSGYRRIGHGWTGARRDGRITWTELAS